LDLLSALRCNLSSSRAPFRALPFAAAVFALAMSGLGQTSVATAAVSTTTTLASEVLTSGKTTLTVHISPVPDAADSRGTVTFFDRDSEGHQRALGSALVAADGTASLTVSSLTAGSHDVHASFSGSVAAEPSDSSPLAITGQAAPADFSLSPAPTTLNLTAGQSGSVAVTITPSGSFNNYVSLSCAGLPLFSTCTFLPSNVDVTGTPGLSTMTLGTVAPSGKTAELRHGAGLVYAFLLPGVFGLVGLGWGRNRGLRTLGMILVAASLIGGASSCAQRYNYLNHGPSPNPGTPNGESIIRIYGTAVNGAQSTTKCIQITLNVKSSNTSGTSGNNLTPCS
jgi:Bacterial Ig-like domain (group 3)